MPLKYVRLIQILDYAIERFIKHFGMKQISLNALEGGGIVVTITNTLVGNNLEGNEVMSLASTVTLDRLTIRKYVRMT